MIKILFGGIAIPEQNIMWSLTPGTLPFTSSITVPLTIAEKILKLKNPISLDFLDSAS